MSFGHLSVTWLTFTVYTQIICFLLQGLDGLDELKKPVAIIGNKCDLEEERVVSLDEATAFVEDMGLRAVWETSAKANINVTEVSCSPI